MEKDAVTACQLRAARALLGWSAERLSAASHVGLATIRRGESEFSGVTMSATSADTLRRALEKAGVEFIEPNGGGPGVRLREPVGRATAVC